MMETESISFQKRWMHSKHYICLTSLVPLPNSGHVFMQIEEREIHETSRMYRIWKTGSGSGSGESARIWTEHNTTIQSFAFMRITSSSANVFVSEIE